MNNMIVFLKRVRRYIYRLCGKVLYYFIPIDMNSIVFQSEGDFWDNAYALFDYMITNKFNDDYKLIWLVQDPQQYQNYRYKNVEFVKRNSDIFKEMLYEQKIMRSSHFFFFTHRGYKQRRKNQVVINLWHGSVVMKACNGVPKIFKTFDYQCCSSPIAAERMRNFTGVRENQIIINSDCRQDYLFSDCKDLIRSFLGNSYNKYILGMPTFKKAKQWTDAVTESWILPVIRNKNEFDRLNAFCKKENILLILKIHHLEDVSFIDATSTTNIRIIKDEDLQKAGIQLYQLIGKTDALLTDFSSVAYDYMLLNKPIGYMVSEKNNYSRGFIIENIEEEMPGEKINNLKDLENFLLNVKDGIDLYKEKRDIIKNKFFVYQNSDNCERLLKLLNISKH